MTSMPDWPVTNARRFEIYVRWSLYLLLLVMPLQYLALLVGRVEVPLNPWVQYGAIGLSFVLTAFHVLAARWCFDRVMQGPAPVPVRWVVAWMALLIALAVLTAFTQTAVAFPLLWYPIGCAVAAITPLLTIRRTLLVSAAAGAIALLVAIVGYAAVLFGLVLFLFLIWTAWSASWMLRVLKELQRAHETEAQLTLAEERLRISRDLHDVFGRTLATISVKSELASELSRRGHHDRAADEMAQIRQIANTAGAEVRRVVRGERRASWADEVEGARALLVSAGIRCVIAGEDVPEEYAETLAWVIREGVTNVLRHSRATQVSITTAVEPDEVALTLTSDGAGAAGPASQSTGTGLASMQERLRSVGGELEYQRDGDWFLLTASIPVPQEVSA